MFLFWPFAALVHVLYNFKNKGSKEVFWFFCIFFGFIFIYEDPALQKFSLDSAYYANELIQLQYNPVSVQQIFSDLINKKEDIYSSLITLFVSYFTYDPRYLFVIFATIYGYLYASNLWMVFERVEKKVDIFLFFLMAMFVLVLPIWNINGVRMYTAAQLLLFGLLKYNLQGKKYGLFLILSTTLVHFSFLYPVVVFLLNLIIPGRSTKALLVLYVISMLLGELDLVSTLKEYDFGESIYQEKLTAYTHEDYLANLSTSDERLNLQVILSKTIFRWTIFALAVYIFMKINKFNFPIQLSRFINFSLLFGATANIANNFPSGYRFVMIANYVFLANMLLIVIRKENNFLKNTTMLLLLPPIAFISIMWFRLGMQFFGIEFFVGNPATALFSEKTDPVIETIKKLLSF